jgi:hypothetical protein
MKFDPVKVIHIYYKPCRLPMDDKIFVGRLAINNRKLFLNMIQVL